MCWCCRYRCAAAVLPVGCPGRLLLLLSLWNCLYCARSFGVPSIFGSYLLSVKDIQNCKDVGSKNYSFFTNGPNCSVSTQCYTTLNIKKPFDDQVWVFHSVDIWVNGGWKLLGQTNFTKGCSETTEAFPEFFDLFENFNTAVCPVPKGRYNLKDFNLKDVKMSKFPKLPYSRYQDTVVAYRTGKRAGCVIFTFDVTSRAH